MILLRDGGGGLGMAAKREQRKEVNEGLKPKRRERARKVNVFGFTR